jgi:hypothetical protein
MSPKRRSNIQSTFIHYHICLQLQLHAYTNFTWASDIVDRRSITEYCLFLVTSLIAWKSKNKHMGPVLVLRSRTWHAWSHKCYLRLYISYLDCQWPVKHEITEHIGLDASFTCSHCLQSTIHLQYVFLELQVREFSTKSQIREQHCFFSYSQTQYVGPCRL